MKRVYATVAVIGIVATLAACGPNKPAEATPVSAAATPASADATAAGSMPASGDMTSMAMDPAAVTAKATGVVTAIDKAAGTVTLDHGPIPEAKWPAMTMTFKAVPASLVDQVKVRDHVAFDLKLKGGSGEVTSIKKR